MSINNICTPLLYVNKIQIRLTRICYCLLFFSTVILQGWSISEDTVLSTDASRLGSVHGLDSMDFHKIKME